MAVSNAFGNHQAVYRHGYGEGDGKADDFAPPEDAIMQFGVDGAGYQPFHYIVDDFHRKDLYRIHS